MPKSKELTSKLIRASIRKFFLAISICSSLGFYKCQPNEVVKGFNHPDVSPEFAIDTRLGTGGILWSQGHVSPAASTPFGFVSLGPDTATFREMFSSSGYSDSDSEVIGFSHSRYSGTGLAEGGLLRVTPSTKPLNYESFLRHYLPLNHAQERALPGYYSIYFSKPKIQVELTANGHAGVHSYQFKDGSTPHLIIEPTSTLSKDGKTKNLKLELDNNKLFFKGSVEVFDGVSKRHGGLKVFFIGKFNVPWNTARFFNTEKDVDLSSLQKEGRYFIDLEFSETSGQPLEFRAAFSYVSMEGAENNLAAEVAEKTFAQVRDEAQQRWRQIFSRIQISTNDADLKRQFYTALYHSFIMPTIVSDVAAFSSASATTSTSASASTPVSPIQQYLGYDGKIHSSSHPYFGNFSLWDTFRTVHPLYNLIARPEQKDMIESLLKMSGESGRVPRWGGQAGHSDSMLGFPGHIAIAEAALKGIPFDHRRAYEAMNEIQKPLIQLKNGQECLQDYVLLGYCPVEHGKGSVSYTLEYAYSDYALGLLAAKLGLALDSEYYLDRSENVRNIWNERNHSFEARHRSGSNTLTASRSDTSYFPLNENGKSVFEGSLEQWKWYLPYNRNLFIELNGPNFASELIRFFEGARPGVGTVYPGIYYWHGNEPDIHAAYLFNWAGRPDLTAQWVRWTLNNKYANQPRGLDGEDDAGTLSAWYIFSVLGIYPIAGTTQYFVGTPQVDSATLTLDAGKNLKIIKTNPDPKLKFVRSITINGKALKELWFDHSLIADGGEIQFEMGQEPNSWSGK